MRRRDLTLGAAGAALVLSSGGARAQQVVWEEVTAPDGRYRLQLPSGYRYLTVPRHDGGAVNSFVATLPGGLVLELMEVTLVGQEAHFPASAAELQSRLVQIQGGIQKSWPGSTVVEQRPIELGSVTGREFVLGREQDRRIVFVRVYFAREAIYTQVAQGIGVDPRNPTIAQFMNSLRLQQL
jgi:hypothetical protein